jgi:protein TonB
LQGHRNYPEAARRRGEQGSVGLRFTVLRDGHVQDVSIIRPSDFAALDTAALTMLQGTLVPEFPASMPQQSITVTVTVRFSLTK